MGFLHRKCLNISKSVFSAKKFFFIKFQFFFRADLDHYTLYTESLSPELRLDADYELNGKILLLPVQGQGPCVITLGTKITFFL